MAHNFVATEIFFVIKFYTWTWAKYHIVTYEYLKYWFRTFFVDIPLQRFVKYNITCRNDKIELIIKVILYIQSNCLQMLVVTNFIRKQQMIMVDICHEIDIAFITYVSAIRLLSPWNIVIWSRLESYILSWGPISLVYTLHLIRTNYTQTQNSSNNGTSKGERIWKTKALLKIIHF